MYIEDANKFRGLQNKQELLNYHRNLKAIVSHMQNKHKLIVEGQYMSTYMGIGLAIGVGLGSAFKNIATGVSIGLCIGLAVGAGIDACLQKKTCIIAKGAAVRTALTLERLKDIRHMNIV